MYRIMLVKSKKDDYASLYQYLTTTVDGVISPVEFTTIEALDMKVEHMLNEEGYAKSDFIIVQPVDYTIDANSYVDNGGNVNDSETGDPAENDGDV